LALTYSARWSRRIFSGVIRLTPISPPRLVPAHPPNQGSFPPPALPGFLGRMSPSDVCQTRFPLEPLSGDPDSRQTSRVANPRVRTCCAHYPGEQDHPHMSVHRVVLGGLRL
jgi:hypothetical protein